MNVSCAELEKHYSNLFDKHFDIDSVNEERVNNEISDLHVSLNNFETIKLNINDFINREII